ncbi:EI24 domain-containing protein [Pseudoroseicyclus sp. CXY001]|uniref:EI24 domain-containing protein n=1 Tax=Pseudoroseicyclus sp. CXY001 TaxID=3242492 RepID=UPI00358DD7F9
MILGDFLKALGQIGDPRFRRVLIVGVLLALALLFGFYALLLWGISALDAGQLVLPMVGQVTWLGDLLAWGSLVLMFFLSMFLMIPVASAITSMFLDDVAAAVEAEHYPALPPVEGATFWEGVVDTVNFLGVLIAANIVALFAYAALPPFAPFIFYLMNGYLLGREYFQIAAMRREGRDGAKQLRKKHIGTIWVAGCLMALPLSIPLVNLLVPVLGAATFTHLYHRLKGPRLGA